MPLDLASRIEQAAAMLVRYGATAVYVFGSAVAGELRDDSDVDLAVTGLPPRVFFRAMAEASRIVGRPVDILALDSPHGVPDSLVHGNELKRVA